METLKREERKKKKSICKKVSEKKCKNDKKIIKILIKKY